MQVRECKIHPRVSRHDGAAFLIKGRVDLLPDDRLALRGKIGLLRGDHIVNAALRIALQHDLRRLAAAEVRAAKVHTELLFRGVGRGAAVHRLRNADLTVLGHVNGKFHRIAGYVIAQRVDQTAKLIGRII